MNTVWDELRVPSGLSAEDWILWCGSVVRDDGGGFHLYFSAWEREAGFEAWVSRSRVGHAFAPRLGAPFVFRSWCLPGAGAEGAWDRDVTHNPTALRDGGRTYLYYMGNFSDTGEWWDHRNHQRIGVAWSDAPEGPFRRSAEPVLRHGGAVMTSNPSVCRLPSGGWLMVYKWVADERPGPFYGPVRLGAALADSPSGPFEPVSSDLFPVPGVPFPGEDPFVYVRGDRLCCLLKDNGRNYSRLSRAIVRFESADGGRTWRNTGPVLGRTRPDGAGRFRRDARVERPQLLFLENGAPLLLCAVKRSRGSDDTFLRFARTEA